MSLFKYYAENSDADGDALWWPGGPEGFPFRGKQPPNTSQSEYENLKLTGKFRCQTFYLANDKELAEYITIRDKCSNGLFIAVDRDRQWDEESKNYRVYMEWVELAYDTPPSEVHDAVRDYTNSSTISSYRRLAGISKDW